MQTEKIDIISGDRQAGIARAAKLLADGGIVAIPTETVYGLAASAYDGDAIDRVFKAKGRPQNNPLIVHISDFDMINDVAANIPDTARVLAEKFWPGPLTMVLKKKDTVAKSVSRGLDTVAIRMPASLTAREIIRAAGVPLAAPSANISGRPSPTTAAHVLNDLDGRVDGIVIGEDCAVGVESTVVSLAGTPSRLLRPGAVTAEQLREFLPDLVIDRAVLSKPEKDVPVASPGMLYKHYAPSTETFLVEGDSGKFTDFLNSKENCAAICFVEDLPYLKCKKLPYGQKNDKETLAKNLFGVLREADKLGTDTLYIHAPDLDGIGLAIYNRLIRAAAFKVIKL
ncbi:MAG: threonylcarbamoyl-AMP synthase [Clostridia bacterium]|nr:threonylcarbamoyl-AMP synthase [Clostridia bacterium]